MKKTLPVVSEAPEVLAAVAHLERVRARRAEVELELAEARRAWTGPSNDLWTTTDELADVLAGRPPSDSRNSPLELEQRIRELDRSREVLERSEVRAREVLHLAKRHSTSAALADLERELAPLDERAAEALHDLLAAVREADDVRRAFARGGADPFMLPSAVRSFPRAFGSLGPADRAALRALFS